MSILNFESLTVEIGGQTVCRDLDLKVETQNVLGILGRNGVGKSTLLYTIMGFIPPASGKVKFQELEIQKYEPKNLAKKLGILFQENHSDLPATVLETALLGRHPHSENLLWDSPEDTKVTLETLDQLGLAQLSQRQISTLSGGEKQRLALASLMIQAPELYLLDEPSNHLDIDYQIKTLKHLKKKISQEKASVIMASHDINLTARFSDQILLLTENGQFLYGDTTEVLNEESLSQAYNCDICMVESAGEQYFFPA
jgi:iron complex transport system ATP-binding protein